MSAMPNFQSLTEQKTSQEPYVLHFAGEMVFTTYQQGYILWDQYGNKFQLIVVDGTPVLILEKVQPGLSNYNEILNRLYIVDIVGTTDKKDYLHITSIASHCFEGITSKQPIFLNFTNIGRIEPFAFKNYHGDIYVSDININQLTDAFALVDLMFYQSSGIGYLDVTLQEFLIQIELIEERKGVKYLKNTNLVLKNQEEFGLKEILFDTLQFTKSSSKIPREEEGSISYGSHGIGDLTIIESITEEEVEETIAKIQFNMESGFAPFSLYQRVLFTEDSKVHFDNKLIPLGSIDVSGLIQFPYLPSTIIKIIGFNNISIGTMDITSCVINSTTVSNFFSCTVESGEIFSQCFQNSWGALLVTQNQYDVMNTAGLLVNYGETGTKKFINSGHVIVKVKGGSQ